MGYCYAGATANAERLKGFKREAVKEIFGTEMVYDKFYQWNNSGRANLWSRMTPAQRTITALRSHLRGSSDQVSSAITSFAVGMSAAQPPGRYSAAELDTCATIGRALAMQTATTAGTSERFRTGVKSRFERAFAKGAAGEGRQGGIYSTHEYTVTGIEARPRGYLGVFLRNPHGKTGRKYRMGPDGALGNSVATSAAEFWMELRDFCADFNTTCVHRRSPTRVLPSWLNSNKCSQAAAELLAGLCLSRTPGSQTPSELRGFHCESNGPPSAQSPGTRHNGPPR